jgi:hypothetical protein
MDERDILSTSFEQYRARLRAVAYRTLPSPGSCLCSGPSSSSGMPRDERIRLADSRGICSPLQANEETVTGGSTRSSSLV